MIDSQVLEVWLETEGAARALVPYVRSAEPATAGWRLRLTREHRGGRSDIRQSGTVSLAAGVPRRLSSTAVGREHADRCSVEIEITEGDRTVRTYRFECPR